MNVEVIASVKPYNNPRLEEMILFGGKLGGICYMQDDFETLKAEDPQKTMKRAQMTLKAGHHSIYDHLQVTLLLSDIPKIIAMVLNNEKFYTTSEKSARYTEMKVSDKEKKLYDKWREKIEQLIRKVYPDIPEKYVEKLAMENARYMISVFTPTVLAYTTGLRQLNYIIRMMEKFIEEYENTPFTLQLKHHMKDFIGKVKEQGLYVEELDCSAKNRTLSLFNSWKEPQEQFGDIYSTTYKCSLAMLAQAQRHRTIWYRMKFDENSREFYVPPIVEKFGMKDEWLEDINSIADKYPQGKLVEVNERGTYEAFLLKCSERLCGRAQLEIMMNTKSLYEKFMKALGEEVQAKTKCVIFNGCKEVCFFGPKLGLDRLI